MGRGGRGGRVRGGLLGVLALLLAGTGCSPADGARLGFEGLRVRWSRVPLAEALADDDLPPEWRAKIATVVAVRQFAPGLGLEPGESFSTFTELAADHPGYILTASPRARLQPYTWWTPPVDAVPYKGFVELRLAHDEAALLEHRGYDTYIRIASTFRSFGWLDTPLLDEHLRRDDVSLVRLVLRELQREAFALPGARAVPFNESLATFVGHRATIAFFEASAPESVELRRARAAWKAERRYGAYLARLARDLEGTYHAAPDEDAALEAKAELLAAARGDLEALSGHFEELELPPMRVPRNNAAVLYDLYRTSGLDLFESVHAQTHDLRRTIDLLTRAAATAPDAPWEAVRDTLTGGTPLPPVLELLPDVAPPPDADAPTASGRAPKDT